MILDIFTLIITGLLSLLGWVVDLLPMVDPVISAKVVTFRDNFQIYLKGMNYLFPFVDFLTILSIILAVELVIFRLKIGQFILHMVTSRIKGLVR